MVYKATDKKTNELWAVKRLDKRSFEVKNFNKKFRIFLIFYFCLVAFVTKRASNYETIKTSQHIINARGVRQ